VNGNSAARSPRDAVLSRFFTAHGFIFGAEVTPAMRESADAALNRMGVGHLAGTTIDRCRPARRAACSSRARS
jgi:hypothetical protein